MKSRAGFTLVEILVVLVILAILAALLTPTLMEARRSGQTTRCVSNLRQIHAAIVLYRASEGKEGVYGEAHEMGLPPSISTLVRREKEGAALPQEIITCRGETERPRPPVYTSHFSGLPGTPGQPSAWAWYVQRHQENMILVSDPNHDYQTVGQFSPVRKHRALGVYLGGHLRVVVRHGHPNSSAFYLQENP